jgi:F0F1-type ATP synthase assembly protein I
MDDEKLRRELADLKQKELRVRKSFGNSREEEPEAQAGRSRAMRYTWLGAEFAAIFFAFVYGGNFLDMKLGTKPWLVLLGIVMGFGLALYRLIFVAKKLGE